MNFLKLLSNIIKRAHSHAERCICAPQRPTLYG